MATVVVAGDIFEGPIVPDPGGGRRDLVHDWIRSVG
jgi:hypothetical protein